MKAMRGVPGLVVVVALGLGAIVLFRTAGGHPAPKPAAFAGAITLDEALARSEAENRPVLVFATADWCGPCQSFNRGALASERVERLIKGSTIPVYADVTGPDAISMDTARRLGVNGIPALVMVSSGHEVARSEGDMSAQSLEKWLTDSLARVQAPASVTPGD